MKLPNITKSNPEWLLEEALKFIRQIQPTFHEMNMHVGLAGGVLNNGNSVNDLDIIVMGMHNDKDIEVDALYKYMETIGAFQITKENEHYKLNGRVMYRSLVGDKKIDWFIYDVVD